MILVLVRTRIYLGFFVLAVLAGVVGVMALFAFQRVQTSFGEVEKSFPLLLATSRLKGIVSQENALLSSYLLEEDPDRLEAMEAAFAALSERSKMYLEAFRLGSTSEEFLARYGELWEKENFSYTLSPLPQGTVLAEELDRLWSLQSTYDEKARSLRDMWRERLVKLRARNDKAVATDKLSTSVFDFVKNVGEELKGYAVPLGEVYRSLFEAAFCGDPYGQIRKGVGARLEDLKKSIEEAEFSEETKNRLLAKLGAFRGKSEEFVQALSTLEPGERSDVFMEFNMAYQELQNGLEELRLDRWVERLNLFDRERKNFLLLGGEDKERARTFTESVLGSVKRFFEGDFLKLYASQAAQSFLEEYFRPLEASWQEVVQTDGELSSLEARIATAMEEIRGVEEDLTQAMDAMNQEVLSLFVKGVAAVEQTQRVFSQIFRFVAVAIVVIALVLSTVLSRGIVFPLRQGVAFAKRLEQGDLTGEITNPRRDEIGDLLSSLGQASSALRHFLLEVSSVAREMIAATENLHRASQEILTLGSQVAQAVAQVARGSEEQSQSLAGVARRMEELVAEVQTIDGEIAAQVEKISETLQEVRKVEEQVALVGGNLEEVRRAVDSAFSASERGQAILKDVVQSMRTIEESVFSVREIAGRLGESSREIGSITDLITGIAEETNLLALNAAIEAARAGEAGRGFAVVAEEVRKLAEESAQAAQKIAALIREVQQGVEKAVSSVEESRRRVEEGNRAVERAQLAFEDIYKANDIVTHETETITQSFALVEHSSRRITELVQEVMTVSEKNKLRTENIRRMVEEMSLALSNVAAISEENAAASQEVAASSEEQHAALQEIETTVANMARKAEMLEEGLGRFTV